MREPYIFTHNVGLLTLQITNVGLIGNPFIDDLSAGWKGGEYLFFSGLWIGGIGADAGTHVSTAAPFEWRAELDRIWTVYESFEGIKNGVRLGDLGPEAADDDGDGLIDEDFHNGLDDDGDGRIDEDFSAVGQQMFSCMYKDDTPEAIAQIPDHYPMNLLVRQRSFQWSTGGINEFVGIDFEIINIGGQRLQDLYLGFFFDGDIGLPTDDQYWADDLVGWDVIDTTVVMPGIQAPCAVVDATIPATFMWDASGSVPGVFGTLLLDHTVDDAGLLAPEAVDLHTVSWLSVSGQNPGALNDDERYQLLASGTRPVSNPRPGVATGSAGDPDDYRLVWSAGPFANLDPGESLQFQVAQVIGEGFSGFRQNAATTWRVYKGRYIDADGNPNTGIDGKERCLQILELGTQIVWDDPCDTLNTTETFFSTPPCDVAGPHYVDADCDPCTGILGQETPINWLGLVAPPSPTTNLDPSLIPGLYPYSSAMVPPEGDGQVTVQWDNGSELWVDPFAGSLLRVFTTTPGCNGWSPRRRITRDSMFIAGNRGWTGFASPTRFCPAARSTCSTTPQFRRGGWSTGSRN